MIKKTLLILVLATSAWSSILETSPVPSLSSSILAQTSSKTVRSVPREKIVAAYQCGERGPLKYKRKRGSKFKKKRPALGYSYSEGPQWPILCKNTKWGTVAGRYNRKSGATYEWGHKEHKCKQYSVVYGELVHAKATLPSNCFPRALQSNDKNYYYNVIFVNQHGMIPGKASENLRKGWYSHKNKAYQSKDGDFYIVC